MVRDLLDFTRGRLGGGIPAAPQPVDLGDLCRDVADEFRTAHPDRVFHVETAGDLAGRWDPDRLAQALANLCKNAIDYGAPGTAVELRACGAGEAVEVSVANAGGPIAPDALPFLFDPYRRASDRRQRSGLGLGLFIVREIARAHGGTVEPTSTGGRVVFTLRLPRDGRVTPRAGSEAARP
jgi:signal transduction histidine kinase